MLLYFDLFKTLENARWDLEKDTPWGDFDASQLTDEQALTIKMNALTEWSALPATEMFLRDNQGDSDFCAFMSIWFYEEQKHSLALLSYLERFRPDLMPTEAEIEAVRFEFDPAPAYETLMLHYCGEIRLNQWYQRASQWHTEPVIRWIYQRLAEDEARHANAYFKYMRRALERNSAEARHAFAKIGVLMASSSRTRQPLHPTNLHVNKSLFPNDTVQSRLPDPEWLEHWLSHQINFDKTCEEKVSKTIIRRLGQLFDQEFESLHDLQRYRKQYAKLEPVL